jgi:hypothetical protein
MSFCTEEAGVVQYEEIYHHYLFIATSTVELKLASARILETRVTEFSQFSDPTLF